MKKVIFIGTVGSMAIFLFFAAQVFSQKSITKISAFNESLEKAKDKDYKSAITSLLNVYENNKNDYLINLRLGWLYYYIGDYTTSKTYYQKAVEIKKNSIEPLLGSTLPLSYLNEWDSIKDVYKRILKIDSNNYTANLRLGQIYLNAADYKTAKGYLEKAYNQSPSEYEPNLSLGWTYIYLGNNTQAKELFTQALMLSPNDSLATLGMNSLR